MMIRFESSMMEFMAFCIQFLHVRRIKVDVECQSVVWEQ